MKNKIITSFDVAKVAGVSQSTVSRVFMKNGIVSDKTRQKVLKAAQQLNYRPNAFARSLTTNQSRLIGLVFPDMEYPIHMETLQAISKNLKEYKYSAVLIPWQINEHQQYEIPDIFQYRVDGVIAVSAKFNSTLYEECNNFHIPIVQFARIEEGTHCSYAISDNYNAGKEAAKLFYDKGVKNPLYITGEIPTITNNSRYEGFSEEFFRLTQKKPDKLKSSYQYQDVIEKIRPIFNQGLNYDAIFCATDVIAMAVMDVCRYELHMAIPEDLQIIGFDDIPQASWLSYQLTTFRQDYNRLATEAVRIILNQIEHRNEGMIHLLLPTELIIRKTLIT